MKKNERAKKILEKMEKDKKSKTKFVFISCLAVIEMLLFFILTIVGLLDIITPNPVKNFDEKRCLQYFVDHVSDGKNGFLGGVMQLNYFYGTLENFKFLKILNISFALLSQSLNICLFLSNRYRRSNLGFVTLRNKALYLKASFIFYNGLWNLLCSFAFINSIHDFFPFFWTETMINEATDEFCIIISSQWRYAILKESTFFSLLLNLFKITGLFFIMLINFGSPIQARLIEIPQYILIWNIQEDDFFFTKNKKKNSISRVYNFKSVIKKLVKVGPTNFDNSINNFFRSMKLIIDFETENEIEPSVVCKEVATGFISLTCLSLYGIVSVFSAWRAFRLLPISLLRGKFQFSVHILTLIFGLFKLIYTLKFTCIQFSRRLKYCKENKKNYDLLLNSKLQSLGSILNSSSCPSGRGYYSNKGQNICINRVKNITNNISPKINFTIRNQITPIIRINNKINIHSGLRRRYEWKQERKRRGFRRSKTPLIMQTSSNVKNESSSTLENNFSMLESSGDRKESRLISSNSHSYYSPSDSLQKVIDRNIKLPRIRSYISELSNEESGDSDSEEEKEAVEDNCVSLDEELRKDMNLDF